MDEMMKGPGNARRIVLCRRLIPLLKTPDLMFVRGTVQLELAEALVPTVRERLGDYAEIRSLFEEAAGWFGANGIVEYWAQALMGLARLNLLAPPPHGDPEISIRVCLDLLRAAERSPIRHLKPEVLALLGGAYLDWKGGDPDQNLAAAIKVLKQALAFRSFSQEAANRARCHILLGTSYLRLRSGSQQANLRAAHDNFAAGLKLVTRRSDRYQWAALQNNLGVALSKLQDRNAEENQEAAIRAFRAALQVRTKAAGLADWAATKGNMAIAFRLRARGNQDSNVERSRSILEDTQKVVDKTRNPGMYADLIMNLGNAYLNRLRGDPQANVQRAIDLFGEAARLRLQLQDRAEWAKSMFNQGFAHLRMPGDPREDVEEAIRLIRLSLTVRTEKAAPTDWAEATMALGTAYESRQVGDLQANRLMAVQLYEDARRVFGLEKRSNRLAQLEHNLGTALRSLGGPHNVEKAILALQRSLKSRRRVDNPIEWAQTMSALGRAYEDAGQFGKSRARAAERCFRQALEVQSPSSSPRDCRTSATELGLILSKRRRWGEAVAAFELAMRADSVLYEFAAGSISREAGLEERGRISRNAACALAMAGRVARAVEVLEKGRARGLAAAVARDRASLDALQRTAPAAVEQFRQTAARLREVEQHQAIHSGQEIESMPTASLEILAIRLAAARSEFQEAVAGIRALPGRSGFMKELRFGDIRSIAARVPVVYVGPAEAGGFAMIVQSKVRFIRLPRATGDWAADLANTYWAAYKDRESDPEQWNMALDETTRQLWAEVMSPIMPFLPKGGAVALVAMDTFGILPLHAAWKPDGRTAGGRIYALDNVSFTYAPNAQTLAASSVAADRSASESILVVADPQPVSAPPLAAAAMMAEIASAYFGRARVLRGSEARRDRVLRALSHYAVLHFDCHGSADVQDPLRSALMLSGDEPLTVADLYAKQIAGVRLVVLSACETAVAGVELVEEVESLATSFLRAGAAGGVGTLWSVRERSTLMLMFRFYELWMKEQLPPVEALSAAQRWLRDTTNGEKSAHFKAHVASGGPLVGPAGVMAGWVAAEDQQAHSNQSTAHWAAFTYFGA
jgi:CHAT domain-containing protein